MFSNCRTNSNLRLRGGITGYVRLKTAIQQALLVPRTAVIRRKNRTVVFIVDNERARLKEVTVGAMVKDGFLEVHDGLKSGHQVVIFGQDDLTDGDKVDSDWKKWAKRDDLLADDSNQYDTIEHYNEIADEPLSDTDDGEGSDAVESPESDVVADTDDSQQQDEVDEGQAEESEAAEDKADEADVEQDEADPARVAANKPSPGKSKAEPSSD